MFALFMMFGIAFAMGMMLYNIGMTGRYTSPVTGAILGGILSTAYNGALLPGIAVGILAAALYIHLSI